MEYGGPPQQIRLGRMQMPNVDPAECILILVTWHEVSPIAVGLSPLASSAVAKHAYHNEGSQFYDTSGSNHLN